MRISEIFYSVQGEGYTSGVPSVFLRLGHCNLICGGRDGRLQKMGKATWYCDTETVWRSWSEKDVSYVNTWLKENNLYEDVLKGNVHLVITGGEPMFGQQKEIIELVAPLEKEAKDLTNWPYTLYNPYIEVETNGTIMPIEGFDACVNQYNCSPKLSNSGMPSRMRIVPDVLIFLRRTGKAWFKFVISSEEDWAEIEQDYSEYIDKDRIILMPGVDKLKDLSETTKNVWLIAQRERVRMCSRLHILAFDQTTGV